jgi:hypothetical protein
MFRFTIRDVLWLTVVVALSVGWWADRRAKERELESIKTTLRMGGTDATMNELLHALSTAQKPMTNVRVVPSASKLTRP